MKNLKISILPNPVKLPSISNKTTNKAKKKPALTAISQFTLTISPNPPKACNKIEVFLPYEKKPPSPAKKKNPALINFKNFQVYSKNKNSHFAPSKNHFPKPINGMKYIGVKLKKIKTDKSKKLIIGDFSFSKLSVIKNAKGEKERTVKILCNFYNDRTLLNKHPISAPITLQTAGKGEPFVGYFYASNYNPKKDEAIDLEYQVYNVTNSFKLNALVPNSSDLELSGCKPVSWLDNNPVIPPQCYNIKLTNLKGALSVKLADSTQFTITGKGPNRSPMSSDQLVIYLNQTYIDEFSVYQQNKQVKHGETLEYNQPTTIKYKFTYKSPISKHEAFLLVVEEDNEGNNIPFIADALKVPITRMPYTWAIDLSQNTEGKVIIYPSRNVVYYLLVKEGDSNNIIKTLSFKVKNPASFPIGTMLMLPAHTPPKGWALCQGDSIDMPKNPKEYQGAQDFRQLCYYYQLAIALGQFKKKGKKVTLPDCKSRFVVGHGTDYPNGVGSIGGPDTHTHDFDLGGDLEGKYNVTTATNGHSHGLPDNWKNTYFENQTKGNLHQGILLNSNEDPSKDFTGPAGDHYHNISVKNFGKGTTQISKSKDKLFSTKDEIPNRPPHYSLNFIIKISEA